MKNTGKYISDFSLFTYFNISIRLFSFKVIMIIARRTAKAAKHCQTFFRSTMTILTACCMIQISEKSLYRTALLCRPFKNGMYYNLVKRSDNKEIDSSKPIVVFYHGSNPKLLFAALMFSAPH